MPALRSTSCATSGSSSSGRATACRSASSSGAGTSSSRSPTWAPSARARYSWTSVTRSAISPRRDARRRGTSRARDGGGDALHRREQPLDLLLRRVASAPYPHQRLDVEALDDGLRVEVAVAGEEGLGGERAAHLFAGHALHGEGDGGRARAGGRGPVEADAGDRREAVPHFRGEAASFLVQRGPVERLEELDGRGDAGDPFLILRTGLRALRAFARRGIELRKGKRFEQLALRVEDAGVWAVELVRGAGQEVAAEVADVDPLVRREVHRVDEQQRAGV